METGIVKVQFDGDTLEGIRRENRAWMVVKRVCEVRPELRDKLIRYQRECARVLRDHFFGQPQAPALDIRQVVELVAQTIVPAIMAAVDARLASAQATSISRADHQWFRRKLTELAEAEFSLGRHPRKHTVGAVRLALLSELGRCRDVDWESRPWQMLPPSKFAPARVWIDARLRAVQRDLAQQGRDNQRQLAFRAN